MDKLRLFFGVPVADRIRRRVAAIQERLQAAGGKVKWVEPANLHLTLRFLGDVPAEQAEAAIEAGDGCWQAVALGDVSLCGVGAFPNESRPRVVWVGLTRGRDLVCGLHEALSDRLEAKLHMERERRRFSPHLTIGRVKAPPRGDALARVIQELADEDVGSFPVRSFALYESTLTRAGPVYRVVRRYDATGAR